jgi:SH3 domain protein
MNAHTEDKRVTRFAGLLIITLLSCQTLAQELYYVSDEQFIPLRSGPGSEYRIVHRGIPSGTEMVINERSENDTWSRITTTNGTKGWIRSQYLTTVAPASTRLAALEQQKQALEQQLGAFSGLLKEMRDNYRIRSGEASDEEGSLELSGAELAEIRRISSNALTLDAENQRVVKEMEVLKSRVGVLEADNLRLLESQENELFLNGAFAVALGVLITLLVPRLWPKKRRSTSWA